MTIKLPDHVDPTRGPFDQDDTVVVLGVQQNARTGLLFQWSRKDVGFGEIYLGVQADGTVVIDSEEMSDDFVLGVIKQAITEGHRKS